MKTNYKIGETYYTKAGAELTLKKIEDGIYPLRLTDKKGGWINYTVDGRRFTSDKPSLSTSPTEFIAPKEENKCSLKDIFDVYNTILEGEKEASSQGEINKAIQLLKSEGYTITKQF